jgi:hypothetical protein
LHCDDGRPSTKRSTTQQSKGTRNGLQVSEDRLSSMQFVFIIILRIQVWLIACIFEGIDRAPFQKQDSDAVFPRGPWKSDTEALEDNSSNTRKLNLGGRGWGTSFQSTVE